MKGDIKDDFTEHNFTDKKFSRDSEKFYADTFCSIYDWGGK